MSADFSLTGKHVNVAMMTSGGLAPCLSSSICLLAKYWIEAYRAGTISGLTLRFYNAGYKGVLTGDSFVVPESDWASLECLNFLGGSPIGNSRVKVCMMVYDGHLSNSNVVDRSMFLSFVLESTYHRFRLKFRSASSSG